MASLIHILKDQPCNHNFKAYKLVEPDFSKVPSSTSVPNDIADTHVSVQVQSSLNYVRYQAQRNLLFTSRFHSDFFIITSSNEICRCDLTSNKDTNHDGKPSMNIQVIGTMPTRQFDNTDGQASLSFFDPHLFWISETQLLVVDAVGYLTYAENMENKKSIQFILQNESWSSVYIQDATVSTERKEIYLYIVFVNETTSLNGTSHRVGFQLIRLPIDITQWPDTIVLSSTLTSSSLPYHAYTNGEHLTLLGASEIYANKVIESSIKAEKQHGGVKRSSTVENEERTTKLSKVNDPKIEHSALVWVQDENSVTLVFSVPPGLSKSKFRIILSPEHITISIPSALNLLHEALWGPIDPTQSVWTYDDEGLNEAKLSIVLEKKHKQTRWPSVFAETEDKAKSNPYTEVPETIDPAELDSILANMEKYTSETSVDEDIHETTIHPTANTNLFDLEEDRELDCETECAHPLYIYDATYSDSDDVRIVPCHLDSGGSMSYIGRDMDSSMNYIIGTSLDALVIHDHVQASTYPALAYVLESKDDIVQSWNVSDAFVLTLDTHSIHLYYHSQGKDIAKQMVLSLPESCTSSDVLGMRALDSHENTINLILLTKKSIYIYSAIPKE